MSNKLQSNIENITQAAHKINADIKKSIKDFLEKDNPFLEVLHDTTIETPDINLSKVAREIFNKDNYKYAETLVGKAWDYSKKENWMFFDKNDGVEHEVDLFFLYPTSVVPECKDEVCQSIEQMQHNAKRSYLQEGSAFESYTNVYAPYYRQISAVTIISNPTAVGILENCYNNVTRTDVYAALDYYFENCNKGKPFILAGHSQGSCNLQIVLAEYMKEHLDYLKRMVACYPIGFYFPDNCFEKNPHIKKATGELDTNVLITWNTEKPNCKSFNLPLGNNDAFCINPLNWKTDDTYADISLNKGSLLVDGETLECKEVSGLADAKIDLNRGAVICSSYDNSIPPNDVFGEGSFHFDDSSLYYQNLKENAYKRITAYLGHEPK